MYCIWLCTRIDCGRIDALWAWIFESKVTLFDTRFLWLGRKAFVFCGSANTHILDSRMFEIGQLSHHHTTKAFLKKSHKEPQESLECLRKVPLFANVSEKDMSVFLDAADVRFCKKGTVLFHEGETGECFFVICSGWIKLSHALPEGKEAIVDMRTAGHIAGADSVFEKNTYIYNAQVAEDAEVIVLPLSLLKENLESNSALAMGMLSFLSRYHMRQRSEAAINSALCAPQRIAGFMLRLCPENKKENVVFHLPYDKTLIANTLGMTRGSFSRALSELKKESFIRIFDATVEIDSVEQLQDYVYRSLAAKRKTKKKKPPVL